MLWKFIRKLLGRWRINWKHKFFQSEEYIPTDDDDDDDMSTYYDDDDIIDLPEEVVKRLREKYYVEWEMDPAVKAAIEEENAKMAPFYAAEEKYLKAGLGDWMRQRWRYAPPEAMEYPGGPTAVFEEAVRRGITWEEVCGYEEPDWRHFTP